MKSPLESTGETAEKSLRGPGAIAPVSWALPSGVLATPQPPRPDHRNEGTEWRDLVEHLRRCAELAVKLFAQREAFGEGLQRRFVLAKHVQSVANRAVRNRKAAQHLRRIAHEFAQCAGRLSGDAGEPSAAQ